MKGPGSRIDLDVRRVWRCPVCGRRAKAEGGVTSKRCFCTPEGTWMKLVEERRQIRDPFALRDPLSGTGGAVDDEEELPASVEERPAAVSETITPPTAPLEEPQPRLPVPPPHTTPPRHERGRRRRPPPRGRDNPDKPAPN